MNNILIFDTKKKYIKKTFLNFNKNQLIQNLKHEIIKENLEKSNYLLFDMINSGFFKDIWIIFFNIYCEYIHFLNPVILHTIFINYERFELMRKNATKTNLNLLDARNEFNFRKILFMILKKIVKSPKKHIGYFIPQCFNNQTKLTTNTPLLNIFDGKNIPNLNILKEVINNQDYKDVEHALKELHHYIEQAIHKKFTFDQQQYVSKENCFFWLAKILVVGAENTNIIGYPYNISLYHSIDPNSKDYFAPIVWNIILNASKKIGKDYFNHTKYLYKIFNSKLLQKTKRENFLIIQAILFFFEHVVWDCTQVSLVESDYIYLDSIYKKHDTKDTSGNLGESSKIPDVKLKSKDVINESKDEIEKIIEKRKQEIQKLLPPPLQKYNFEEIKRGETPTKKSKKLLREEALEKLKESCKLPSVFHSFDPPSKNDTKITRSVNIDKKRINISIIKKIKINEEKTMKKNSNNTQFIITKIK